MYLAENLNYVCISEFSEVPGREHRLNVAFLTCQEDFATVWAPFSSAAQENVTTSYAYKRDSEQTSYFRPATGIWLQSPLKRNQVWVKRKLRQLWSSGIQRLLDKWGQMKARDRNKRIEGKLLQAQNMWTCLRLLDCWTHGLPEYSGSDWAVGAFSCQFGWQSWSVSIR